MAIDFDCAKCNKCLKCVEICCNSNVISINENGYPYYKDIQKCISCGHCISICPQDAISSKNSKPASNDFYITKSIEVKRPKYDVNEIKQLLFGLRSNRFFSEEPLKKEDVDQILEAMINSPSAGNEQNRKYYVLSTPGKISELEDDIQQIYMNIAKTYKNPIVMIIAGGLLKKHIQEVYQEYNTELSQMDLDLKTKELILSLSIIKKDFYCRKAPQIILVTSDVSKKGVHKDFYKADVEIAVTHGAIMASALGISSCRLGLVEMQINKNKDLLKKLNIPAHEKVNGIISFGYSTVNWVRTPPRGPAQVMWL